MKEIWKNIEFKDTHPIESYRTYERIYQISNLGRVKSIQYYKRKGKIEKILKFKKARGYHSVRIPTNTRGKNTYISHLVAKAFLLNPNKLKYIDHIDRNTYNNCVSNLRWCSFQENLGNRGISKHNKSGYKGVHFSSGKWVAQICCNKKTYYLGFFNTSEEAALAYNKKSKELFGEFAYINKLPD